MALLDSTTEAVTRQDTVEVSVRELLKGVAQELRDLIQGGLVTEQRVAEIADEIEADTERFSNAVVANTGPVVEANRVAESDRLTGETTYAADALNRIAAIVQDPRPDAVKANDPYVTPSGYPPVGTRPGGTQPSVDPRQADVISNADGTPTVMPTDTINPNDPVQPNRGDFTPGRDDVYEVGDADRDINDPDYRDHPGHTVGDEHDQDTPNIGADGGDARPTKANQTGAPEPRATSKTESAADRAKRIANDEKLKGAK